MLSPPIFIAFEVAVIGVFLAIVHEVHVLHPALALDDQGEPDGGENVHDDQQLERHHQNLQVDFDALRQVGRSYRSRESLNTKQFEQTEHIEEGFNARLAVGYEFGKGH